MTNQASEVLQGDCLDKLKELASNSIDSIKAVQEKLL
jgi:DNA modification methylase